MRLSRKGGIVVLGTALVLALASIVIATCKQNAFIENPDGSTQVCQWVCTLPGGGIVTSGCTSGN